jgi:hypothetical protein
MDFLTKEAIIKQNQFFENLPQSLFLKEGDSSLLPPAQEGLWPGG